MADRIKKMIEIPIKGEVDAKATAKIPQKDLDVLVDGIKEMIETATEKEVAVKAEADVIKEKDLYELMDENLSEEEIIEYVMDRQITGSPISDIITDDIAHLRDRLLANADWCERLIEEVMGWPEFVPTLLMMHYHGDIDLKAIAKGEFGNKKPLGRYGIALGRINDPF